MRLRNGKAYRIFLELMATAKPGECLVWPYGKSGNGYGSLWVDGAKVYVHRLAWEFVHGAIPVGQHVLHHCDNPPCFNPYCLFLGTEKDNRADQIGKGRTLRGISNPQSELTESQVRELRSLYRYGVRGRGILALGRRFGVSHSTARKAIRRLTWKHL